MNALSNTMARRPQWLATAAYLAGCTLHADAVTAHKEAQGPATGWSTLYVRAFNTALTVRGQADPIPSASVDLSALDTGGGRTVADIFARTTFEFDLHGDGVGLDLNLNDYYGYGRRWIEYYKLDAYMVLVPAATPTLELQTAEGTVAATGLQGTVRGVCTRGSSIKVDTTGVIDLIVYDSTVHAAAGGGSVMANHSTVDLTWTAARSPLEVHGDHGEITIRVPRGIGLDLDLATSNDHVVVRAGSVERTGDVAFQGSLHGGGTRLTVRNANGSVHVTE
jgi:hypothetical protein